MWFRRIFGLLVALLPPAGIAQVVPDRQECQVTALGVCVRHILQDEGAIVTSPLHARPSDLLWIAPFGLATGVALDYDAKVMRHVGHDTSREDNFRRVSDIGAIYVPIAGIVGGYAAGAWRKDDYLQQTAVIAGEAIVDAQILNQGLKYAINRQSPSQGDETGRFWPHGTKTWPDGTSMPSGHSLTAWTFAHVVVARYPSWKTRLLMYSLATTVSASRVMARDHFPSDVLVGGTLGYLIGGYVTQKRDEPSRSFSFSMVNTPNGRGVQVSYNFNHGDRP